MIFPVGLSRSGVIDAEAVIRAPESQLPIVEKRPSYTFPRLAHRSRKWGKRNRQASWERPGLTQRSQPSIRKDVHHIKEQILDADSFLTEEDYLALLEYYKDKEKGSLISGGELLQSLGK
jgi:hypothetical protein